MVALEAMACGTPVIASQTGAGLTKSWLIRDCALPAPPDDPLKLAGAILYLLSHPERAAQLADNGRTVGVQRYRWDEVAQRTLQVYERLAA